MNESMSGTTWSTLRRIYLKPAFVICTAILAVSASGMSVAVKKFGVILKKDPLPLRKSLDLLDEEGLGPYVVVARQKIDNPDILKALGTEDYVQWILEDSQAAEDSSVRMCSVFITYYDLPDRVPHVPEECYTGSGYQRLASDSVAFYVPWNGNDGDIRKIPVRYLVFAATNLNHFTTPKFPVLYFFNVNGSYANSREEARAALNSNIFGKYSYFSKVEWKFFGASFGRQSYPAKDQAVKAGARLLGWLLPALERHLPAWPPESEP